MSWEFTEFEDAYYPGLAVEAGGPQHNVPHIVFLKHGLSPQLDESLIHYWREENGQWQSETLRGPYDGYDRLFRPAIAAEIGIYDPPKLHVVWEEVDWGPPINTSINYWSPTTGVEEVASANGEHTLEFPTIAVDGGGTPHVLWQDNTQAIPLIQHRYKEAGEWKPTLSQQVAEYAKHPCADEWGNGIYAVWE